LEFPKADKNRMAAPSGTLRSTHHVHHHHRQQTNVLKGMLPAKDLERQQPIIAELIARFDKLQNKRESFRAAVDRPALPNNMVRTRKVGSLASVTSKASSVFTPGSSSKPKPSVQDVLEKKTKTKPVLTMESALADDKLRENFREFIETAFAAENLNFFEAVEKYESLTDESEKLKLAREIINNYVSETAANQVNLPATLAANLIAAVQKQQPEESVHALFMRAKHEILDLMQLNFFDRFLSVVGQPAFVPDDDSEEEKEDDAEEKKTFFRNWVKKLHPKTGEAYYENPGTGVAMWDVPKPIGLPPPIEPPPYY
jgi:hypothetical protein